MNYNVFIILFSLLIFHSHTDAEEISTREKLNLIVNDADWPPFFIQENHSKQKGIARDLLQQCLNINVYNPIFSPLPVKRTHKYMQSGELDISIYSYKKSRENFVLYAKQPLFSSEYALVVKRSSQIQINSIDDLLNYKLGHISGVAYTPELKEIIENKRKLNEAIDGYKIDAMFLKLLAPVPRFDIMIDSVETFYWQAKELGIRDQVKILDYKFPSKQYYLTVSKNSTNIKNKQAFLDEFDACILALKSSGQYDLLLADYGFTP